MLEGVATRIGKPACYIFLAYLLVWSFFVGSGLMSACGVAAHAILPLGIASIDKQLYGMLHSIVAVALVWRGGYRLFEKVMAVCIAVMFLTVITTAIALQPDWSAIAAGLVVPRIPHFHDGGMQWTIALLGGVGGTVTVLCYGYWIREEGREGRGALGDCRLDLATGYLMTALFGIGMVIIGSTVVVEGRGATLVVDLGNRLREVLGPFARWMFLIGAWGAVFSSLLGVWQSVPYLFADLWRLMRTDARAENDGRREAVDTRSRPYRAYLCAIAFVPMLGMFVSFRELQKLNAICGACFMPLLALALLWMNGRETWVGRANRNSWITNALLIAVLVAFSLYGYFQIDAVVDSLG